MAVDEALVGGIVTRVEVLETKIDAVAMRVDEHHSSVAVIQTQMNGVLRLLWMILAAVITVLVAFIAQGHG